MSSSISSSDAASIVRQSWRRFARVFVVGAALLLSLVLATAYAVDPYDTGRSTLLEKRGVRPQGPRTANASRGRDNAFNAAIFGNSHIQLLSPERLSEVTGLSFVQLSVPATGPKEQFLLIDWFMRQHQSPPRAIVVAADIYWCRADPAMPNYKPFPFWLYSRDLLEYVRGLLRYDILEEIPRRFGYLSKARPERARPDGYWNYEPDYIALGYAADAARRARLADRTDLYFDNTTGRFPVAERLRQVLRSLPAETAAILIFPPVYETLLPRDGTAGATAHRQCKDAFSRVLAERPRSAVLDWRVERPETRDPENFFDHTHYREPVARLMEADIAAALRRLDRGLVGANKD